VNLSYKATLPGVQTGAVELTDANGNALATGYLSGVGQGGGLTIDPGTTAGIGTGLQKPAGIAIDTAGNVYIADATANAVLEFASGSTTSVSLGTGLSAPTGVAVDGAGNVFIADTGNNRVVEVPVVNGALSNTAQTCVAGAASSTPACALTLVLSGPSGLAIDSTGNLYIADTGDNQIVQLVNHGGTFDTSLTQDFGSQLNGPLDVAVDAAGDIYIADSGNGQIVEIAQGSSGQALVAVGLSNPSALALDASGSLIVVDQGNARVLRIPNENGSLNPNGEVEVGFGIAAPYGATLDGVGNLYVTDSTNAAAYSIARTQGALAFGDWSLGATSGTLSGSVENSGNQSVTFSSPLYVATGNTGDFSVQSPSTACAASASLAVGTSCTISATFAPAALGARSETLALASNAANSAAWSVVLSGTGASGTATTTALALTSPSSGSPFYGEAIMVSATVAASSGTGTPAGSVSFLVDGSAQPAVALSGGVATLSLPDGLAGGAHTIAASYSGSATFSGSVAASLPITVTLAPTTTTLVVITPYTNPPSGLTASSITISATVASTGQGIPTGTLTFSNGATVLSTQPVTPQAGGTFGATFAASLPAGTYTITVSYSGDSNYLTSASSTSAVLTIVSAPVSAIVPAATTVTASAASPGELNLTVNSYGGWYGIVDFQCSGLPAYATCTSIPGFAVASPSPTSVTQVQLLFKVNVPPTVPTASLLLTFGGGAFGMLFMGFRRRKGVRNRVMLRVGMLMLLAGALQIIPACGSSSSSSQYVTPSGTSTVTVTAIPAQYVSGTTQGATQPPDPAQTFQVQLTVQ
jgi:sugar lactone lactonase YvrE